MASSIDAYASPDAGPDAGADAPELLQPAVDQTLTELDLESAFARNIRDLPFSVSIADPRIEDSPLIAVSEGFLELTGYDRESVVGRNCRFLNEGQDLKPQDREGLRRATESGHHFAALLPNVKADGTPFLNLLDLRGFIGGADPDGNERMFIVGIQADVTDVTDTQDISFEKKAQMQHVANVLRESMASMLQVAALVSSSGEGITPYPEPRWVPNEVTEYPMIGG